MSPSKQNEREAKQGRERLRLYQARQEVHVTQVKRRQRDNWVAAIVVVVFLGIAILGQWAFFDHSAPAQSKSLSLPSPTLAGNRTWSGTLTINTIPLGIELDGKQAPQAVSSTIYLAQKKFYDGLSCHRLTTSGIYVLQCGDPTGTGNGGPGYTYGPIENAPADNVYPAGTIAMARESNNAKSQGSQFFIVYKTSTIPSDTAGGYTVIGRVTSHLDTLISQVTDKGVQGGTTDGKPAVTTTIGQFRLQ